MSFMERVWTVSSALLIASLPALGCDDVTGTRREPLSTVVTQPASDGGGGGYEAMCRNYCAALHDTGFYDCLASGGAADTCAADAPTANQCYDLRCAPHLVQPSLCLTQCDALASRYSSVCAAAAPNALCPSSPADHDQACRAGCAD
jgi:hypothetical protein